MKIEETSKMERGTWLPDTIADTFRKRVEARTATLGDSRVIHHKAICDALNSVYKAKNADYGDSFGRIVDREGLGSVMTRLRDKLSRFERLLQREAEVHDESMVDTLLDLANYAIMTVMYLESKGKTVLDVPLMADILELPFVRGEVHDVIITLPTHLFTPTICRTLTFYELSFSAMEIVDDRIRLTVYGVMKNAYVMEHFTKWFTQNIYDFTLDVERDPTHIVSDNHIIMGNNEEGDRCLMVYDVQHMVDIPEILKGHVVTKNDMVEVVTTTMSMGEFQSAVKWLKSLVIYNRELGNLGVENTQKRA